MQEERSREKMTRHNKWLGKRGRLGARVLTSQQKWMKAREAATYRRTTFTRAILENFSWFILMRDSFCFGAQNYSAFKERRKWRLLKTRFFVKEAMHQRRLPLNNKNTIKSKPRRQSSACRRFMLRFFSATGTISRKWLRKREGGGVEPSKRGWP